MWTAGLPIKLGSQSRLPVGSRRLPSVQILRAAAALSVMLGHALHEASSFDNADVHGNFANEYWKAGVDLFFVLSGFIMMWTFCDRFGQPGAWRDFLRRRLLRIVPLYWLFTAMAVAAAIVFSNRLESTVLTLEHALLSFAFIPHIAPNGGISPLLALGWTLMYEMFFYIAFAAALCFRRTVGLAMLVGVFLLVHVLARGTELLPEALRLFWGDGIMFEFLLGIVFYFVGSSGERSLLRLVSVLSFCLAVGALAHFSGLWSESRFFYFGLPALAVLALFYHALPTVEARVWLLLVLLGDASYTMYLSHPFLLELTKVPIEQLPLASENRFALYLALGPLAAVLFSVAFFTWIEPKPTAMIKWMLWDRRSSLNKATN